MTSKANTEAQDRFLELFSRAAQSDCLYLIDFHCQDLFGHDQTSRLHDQDLLALCNAVNSDILAKYNVRPDRQRTAGSTNSSQKKGFLEPLPLHHLENGLAGSEEQFLFKSWRHGGGVIEPCPKMTALSSKLHLTLPGADPGTVPQITFAGRDTTLRRFFPRPAKTSPSPNSCLSKDYLALVAEGYHVAFSGEPAFDIQRTGSLLDCRFPDMTFQRLLLKFRTKTGFERVFCLLKLLQVHSTADPELKEETLN